MALGSIELTTLYTNYYLLNHYVHHVNITHCDKQKHIFISYQRDIMLTLKFSYIIEMSGFTTREYMYLHLGSEIFISVKISE